MDDSIAWVQFLTLKNCQLFDILSLHVSWNLKSYFLLILQFSRIIALSFAGAIGVLFVVLGCALKEYGWVNLSNLWIKFWSYKNSFWKTGDQLESLSQIRMATIQERDVKSGCHSSLNQLFESFQSEFCTSSLLKPNSINW